MSETLATPPPTRDAGAVEHFRRRLAFETDPADLHADLEAGTGVVVVDTRSDAAWAQGRIPQALHMPTVRIREEAANLIAPGTSVVVYCWSPGCNGGSKAALAFAELGYPVREMIGGFEYWAREGYPVATDSGVSRRAADPLTAPTAGLSCGC